MTVAYDQDAGTYGGGLYGAGTYGSLLQEVPDRAVVLRLSVASLRLGLGLDQIQIRTDVGERVAVAMSEVELI